MCSNPKLFCVKMWAIPSGTSTQNFIKRAPKVETLYHMEYFNHLQPVEYVRPLGLLTSNLHSLRSETAFGIGKKAWNILSFVNMMELVFYMANTCFANQIVSINLLN